MCGTNLQLTENVNAKLFTKLLGAVETYGHLMEPGQEIRLGPGFDLCRRQNNFWLTYEGARVGPEIAYFPGPKRVN